MWMSKASKGERVALFPTDDESTAALRKLGDGELVTVKISRPRSIRWHRMYWGICSFIGENQEPARSKDSIDSELRVLAGHYDVIHARRGNELYEVRVPRRIAFDKLDADEWAQLWPSLELAGRERFGSEYFDMAGKL